MSIGATTVMVGLVGLFVVFLTRSIAGDLLKKVGFDLVGEGSSKWSLSFEFGIVMSVLDRNSLYYIEHEWFKSGWNDEFQANEYVMMSANLSQGVATESSELEDCSEPELLPRRPSYFRWNGIQGSGKMALVGTDGLDALEIILLGLNTSSFISVISICHLEGNEIAVIYEEPLYVRTADENWIDEYEMSPKPLNVTGFVTMTSWEVARDSKVIQFVGYVKENDVSTGNILSVGVLNTLSYVNTPQCMKGKVSIVRRLEYIEIEKIYLEQFSQNPCPKVLSLSGRNLQYRVMKDEYETRIETTSEIIVACDGYLIFLELKTVLAEQGELLSDTIMRVWVSELKVPKFENLALFNVVRLQVFNDTVKPGASFKSRLMTVMAITTAHQNNRNSSIILCYEKGTTRIYDYSICKTKSTGHYNKIQDMIVFDRLQLQEPILLSQIEHRLSILVSIEHKGLVALSLSCFDHDDLPQSQTEPHAQPHICSQQAILVSPYDGLWGDDYVIRMSIIQIMQDRTYRPVIYLLDGRDLGNLRTTTLLTDGSVDDWNAMHSLQFIYSPTYSPYITQSVSHNVSSTSRKFSNAPMPGLITTDWNQRSLSLVTKHPTKCKLQRQTLIYTQFPPQDVEATAAFDKYIIWTEPLRESVLLIAWEDVKGAMKKKEVPILASQVAQTVVRGRKISGMYYSRFFGSIYMADPVTGEITSAEVRENSVGSLNTHFAANNYDVPELLLKFLRPLSLVVHDKTGHIYFTTMSAPNLSAYDLSGTFADQEAKYMTMGTNGYPRVPEDALKGPLEPRDIACSVWILRRRPFSTSLKYPPEPYYTNSEAVIIDIDIQGDYLTLVERNIKTKQCRIVRIRTGTRQASGEHHSHHPNPGAISPRDIKIELEWIDADIYDIFTATGDENVWTGYNPQRSMQEMALRSRSYGWVALAMLISNLLGAMAYGYIFWRRSRRASPQQPVPVVSMTGMPVIHTRSGEQPITSRRG